MAWSVTAKSPYGCFQLLPSLSSRPWGTFKSLISCFLTATSGNSLHSSWRGALWLWYYFVAKCPQTTWRLWMTLACFQITTVFSNTICGHVSRPWCLSEGFELELNLCDRPSNGMLRAGDTDCSRIHRITRLHTDVNITLLRGKWRISKHMGPTKHPHTYTHTQERLNECWKPRYQELLKVKCGTL